MKIFKEATKILYEAFMENQKNPESPSKYLNLSNVKVKIDPEEVSANGIKLNDKISNKGNNSEKENKSSCC